VREQLAEGDRQADAIMASRVGGREVPGWRCSLVIVEARAAVPDCLLPPVAWQDRADPDYDPNNPAEEDDVARMAG
jgi:hypothetical protein